VKWSTPPKGKDPALQAQLATLRKQIESTPLGRARLHNQAGDLLARAGEDQEALREYGKAIDAYIADEQIQLAVATCTKIIRRAPNVTRAHFTLACLFLYQGHRIEALRSIEAYGAAASVGGTQNMVLPRLRFLAKCVADPQVRAFIADQLTHLGDPAGARMVRDSPPPSVEGLIDPDRQPLLLEAATLDSGTVWAEFWLK
jgi:hypothetical protein